MAAPNRFEVHSKEFLRALMRKQLKLSTGCAFAFLAFLLGLPLANYLAPQFMSCRVGGFTLAWLLLGVCFFPAVWIIAWVFVRRSLKLEDEEVRLATTETATPGAGQAPMGTPRR